MDFLAKIVKPSPQITDPIESNRAQLLTWLLMGRAVALVTLLCVLASSDFPDLQAPQQTLYFAIFFNVVAYVVSRSKNYRWAAYLIIVESIVGIPATVYRMPFPDVISAAPYWMTFGSMLSSLVLPVRQTIFFTFASVLGFFFMSFVVPSTGLPALGAALIYFGLTSILAAIGTAMRENTERAYFTERRGPPTLVNPVANKKRA